MRTKTFLGVAILVGVLAASFFVYDGDQFHSGVKVAARTNDPAAQNIFPAPGRTSYKMKLYLDTGEGMLYGQTNLSTVNTSIQSLHELWFTAYPNAFKDQGHTPAPASAYYGGFDPGWMKFRAITVNGHKAGFTEQGVSVRVNLPQSLNPGAKLNILIEWEAKIPRAAYRYGNNRSVYMLGNFYPALNLLDKDGWHNSVNSVFGDPFCFPCADYQVEVNIPEDYLLVSTGTRQETIADDTGRQTCLIQAPNARDFCMAVVYDYSETSISSQNTLLRCYAPSGDSQTARRVLEQSRDIFNYYACTFGSYPYKEFKIVFVPMEGFHGMEYSGVIFLRAEFLSSGQDQHQNEFLLAHEIAHQWWYSVVGNDQVKEPWLDEGLANWSAYKYLEDRKGQSPPPEAFNTKGVKLTRELQEIYSAQDYYQTAYSGGEAFWFGLEKELGSDQVVKVLRKYYADFRYAIATTDDLKYCIKVEARRDMEAYFQCWFGN
ncbi:MAG TPA: M1 family metallopeptidase [Syntrophomonadaceae bacterium]|nr:M1 family metallopeptidase [Syntrophomonadaceae bacterium]